ncbi:MAG TPA: GtrA family protein [Candidatus Paceibacterota bacterium]|nr:GtrA family protein [Candidatus Paceibacterota bacterium]
MSATLLETIERLAYRIVFSVVSPTIIILISLYIFNAKADVRYLPASGLAFGIGFFFIYLAFKYLIKPDPSKKALPSMRNYIIVFIINLAINTEIVYLLVSHAGVPLLTAQTVAAVVIAYESYYAYQSLANRGTKKAVVRLPKSLEDEIVYYDEDGQQL